MIVIHYQENRPQLLVYILLFIPFVYVYSKAIFTSAHLKLLIKSCGRIHRGMKPTVSQSIAAIKRESSPHRAVAAMISVSFFAVSFPTQPRYSDIQLGRNTGTPFGMF